MNKLSIRSVKNSNQLEICFAIEDDKTKKMHWMQIKHTDHSQVRASQRGINSSRIAIVLSYGQIFFKQGMVFYILTENDIPDFLTKEKSHLKNTVVVTSGDSNQVITCYKSKNAIRKIKQKPKSLAKYNRKAA